MPPHPEQHDCDEIWSDPASYPDEQDPYPSPCLLDRFDRALRHGDTFLARAVTSLCSLRGEEYLNSKMRRRLDLSIAIPAAVITTPLIWSLAVAKKLEDGGTMFFYQDRLSPTGDSDVHLMKIRCMNEHADQGGENIQYARGRRAHEDPRNTRLGTFMRRFQLEELPQLYQVIEKKISFVGIRPAPQYVFDEVAQTWDANRYNRWQSAYRAGRGGITGLNQVLNNSEKDDTRRHRFDIFYAENASLGLDLYILWRTLRKMLRL